MRLASHSFAVDINGLRVVIDTGIGNSKPRANPAWNQLDTDYLARLTAAGFSPETVDLVILTTFTPTTSAQSSHPVQHRRHGPGTGDSVAEPRLGLHAVPGPACTS